MLDQFNTLSRVRIAIASLEKVVPTLEDTSSILRVLACSATGQEMSSYRTFSTGPHRSDNLDGPQEYHVILLDNRRSGILGTEFQDMLRCIRCAACVNHFSVYGAVGGHTYGLVYPGPIRLYAQYASRHPYCRFKKPATSSELTKKYGHGCANGKETAICREHSFG